MNRRSIAQNSANLHGERLLTDPIIELRKLYGAKLNAITAACGYVSGGILHIENGNEQAGLNMLREAERILVDA